MVFDVFLIDSDFKIERPTRYYRRTSPDFTCLEAASTRRRAAKGKGKEVG